MTTRINQAWIINDFIANNINQQLAVVRENSEGCRIQSYKHINTSLMLFSEKIKSAQYVPIVSS